MKDKSGVVRIAVLNKIIDGTTGEVAINLPLQYIGATAKIYLLKVSSSQRRRGRATALSASRMAGAPSFRVAARAPHAPSLRQLLQQRQNFPQRRT